MGLPKAGELVSFNARFSDSVLKIELSGPDYDHFSVVDIPGLFQSETQYQTVEDALIVEGVVKKYINDSRTIILYVPFLLKVILEAP